MTALQSQKRVYLASQGPGTFLRGLLYSRYTALRVYATRTVKSPAKTKYNDPVPDCLSITILQRNRSDSKVDCLPVKVLRLPAAISSFTSRSSIDVDVDARYSGAPHIIWRSRTPLLVLRTLDGGWRCMHDGPFSCMLCACQASDCRCQRELDPKAV